MHKCGIIHRDVKPSNILIKFTENGSLQLKIIDFSISKVATEKGVDILNDLFSQGILDLDSDRNTQHVTTRVYRAPEVALLTQYDQRIDIWAAGCIFAEMLESLITQQREILFYSKQCMPLSQATNHMNYTKIERLMTCRDLLVLHAKFFRQFDYDTDLSFLVKEQ